MCLLLKRRSDLKSRCRQAISSRNEPVSKHPDQPQMELVIQDDSRTFCTHHLILRSCRQVQTLLARLSCPFFEAETLFTQKPPAFQSIVHRGSEQGQPLSRFGSSINDLNPLSKYNAASHQLQNEIPATSSFRKSTEADGTGCLLKYPSILNSSDLPSNSFSVWKKLYNSQVSRHFVIHMLSHYEPLETLAPALFGYVQKWRHLPTGECVAVKRMELRFAARQRSKSLERTVEEDLLTEIKTNLRVQLLGGHPNVLPLRDCIMEDEAVLLVLKFCQQGELLDVLNTKRAAGQPINVLHYFVQMLRGAAFLHANDIAHRDLSLENVLVDEQDCCCITDFGLATQCQGKIAVKPVGKLRYMAPEVSAALTYQEGQSGEYDPKVADVWALGVMLYAMVAARYPFREPLRNDARFRLLEDFGVDYLLEKDEVDVQGRKEVVDLLRKMLVVDPAKRSTLEELESHLALPVVNNGPGLRVKQVQPEDSVPRMTVTSSQDTRQRARSLGRFTGKAVSPNKSLSEAEKNKQAQASSIIGNNEPKSQCAGGRLLHKCLATALA